MHRPEYALSGNSRSGCHALVSVRLDSGCSDRRRRACGVVDSLQRKGKRPEAASSGPSTQTANRDPLPDTLLCFARRTLVSHTYLWKPFGCGVGSLLPFGRTCLRRWAPHPSPAGADRGSPRLGRPEHLPRRIWSCSGCARPPVFFCSLSWNGYERISERLDRRHLLFDCYLYSFDPSGDGDPPFLEPNPAESNGSPGATGDQCGSRRLIAGGILHSGLDEFGGLTSSSGLRADWIRPSPCLAASPLGSRHPEWLGGLAVLLKTGRNCSGGWPKRYYCVTGHWSQRIRPQGRTLSSRGSPPYGRDRRSRPGCRQTPRHGGQRGSRPAVRRSRESGGRESHRG